jgi:8-oxo-dGTP pyrophosphatase MutT (NUDIX family)
VKGLVTNDGALLFVRHTYGPHEWELPGGGQRRHELPREALTRELREELAIEVSDPVALGTFKGPAPYRNNVVTYFGVAVADRDIRMNPVELAEVRWCDPADPPRPLGWYAQEALRRTGKGAATM